MREIKFRAWSILTKTMSPPADFPEWIRQYQLRPEAFPPAHFHPNAAVLMQFTGLKDKNGTPLYEGDILQVANNYKYEVAFITEDEDDEKVCGFGLLAPLQGRKFLIDTFAINEGKVIGNIYENPNLLNSKE